MPWLGRSISTIRVLVLVLCGAALAGAIDSGPLAASATADQSNQRHIGSDNSLAGRAENTVATWAGGMGVWGPVVIAGVILLAGVGIPVSEEILVIPSGFLVGQGVFDLWWTFGLIWLAVVLADLIWMLLVRRYSHVLLSPSHLGNQIHARSVWPMGHHHGPCASSGEDTNHYRCRLGAYESTFIHGGRVHWRCQERWVATCNRVAHRHKRGRIEKGASG